MSLYVRLDSSFWTNRKTLRLHAILGDAAYWLPPRLWSYASIHQPDGDFSDYGHQELAMLLGYSGNAQAMLQALKTVGFMEEDGKVHDWKHYNGYHSLFAERARNAANVRWSKEKKQKKEKTVQDKRREETSIASSNANASSTRNGLVDSEWIARLINDPTYKGIEVQREFGKMANWCRENRVEPTRRRFINWLNRADRKIVGVKPDVPKKLDPSKIDVPERFKSWASENYPDRRETIMKYQTWADVPQSLRQEWWKEEKPKYGLA